MPLVVVSILQENRVIPDNQSHAKVYLESHGVQAKYVSETGYISSTILKVAVMNNSDLIVMGGYGHTPLFNILINDVVDQVLRESPKPMLLCR
jgi:nucleotide-binding universal stress UspA family protein